MAQEVGMSMLPNPTDGGSNGLSYPALAYEHSKYLKSMEIDP